MQLVSGLGLVALSGILWEDSPVRHAHVVQGSRMCLQYAYMKWSPVRYRPNAASGGWSYGRDMS